MSRLIDADAMRKEWLENGENEFVYDTNAVLESIDKQPIIDPVHAAGGCYCGECVNLGSDVFDDDSFYCHYWGYSIRKDDYCSRGERREENA